jgi:hypothetical protein
VKRSGPPERRTALRSDPATARAWRDRSRRKPGNQIPAASRIAVRIRSQDNCEARLPGCHLTADHMHHIAPRRSRDHSAANLLHVCSFDGTTTGCHELIHANPEMSYRRGFLERGR